MKNSIQGFEEGATWTDAVIRTLALVVASLFLVPAGLAAQGDGTAADSTSEAYQTWKTDLEDARAKRGRGQTITWAGLGGAAAGGLVAATNPGSYQAAAILGIAGSAAAIYGGVTWMQAESEIKELKAEGRREGYITIGPTIYEGRVGGARISVSVPWTFGR